VKWRRLRSDLCRGDAATNVSSWDESRPQRGRGGSHTKIRQSNPMTQKRGTCAKSPPRIRQRRAEARPGSVDRMGKQQQRPGWRHPSNKDMVQAGRRERMLESAQIVNPDPTGEGNQKQGDAGKLNRYWTETAPSFSIRKICMAVKDEQQRVDHACKACHAKGKTEGIRQKHDHGATN